VELYLIRHAQSSNNALDSETERVHDPELTKLGHRQASLLGEFIGKAPRRDPWMNVATGHSQQDDAAGLKLTHLYVSPMYRALQTTLPIAQATNTAPVVRYDIFEHGGMYLENSGVITPFPGKTRKQVLKEFPRFVLGEQHADYGWYDVRVGKEAYEQCCARAIKLAIELRERAMTSDRESRIGIVTHGTYMDLLVKALMGLLPSRMLYFQHYNTAITRIDLTERDRVILRYLNRVDHLPADLIS